MIRVTCLRMPVPPATARLAKAGWAVNQVSFLKISEKTGRDEPRPYVFHCRGGIYPALSDAETPRTSLQTSFAGGRNSNQWDGDRHLIGDRGDGCPGYVLCLELDQSFRVKSQE